MDWSRMELAEGSYLGFQFPRQKLDRSQKRLPIRVYETTLRLKSQAETTTGCGISKCPVRYCARRNSESV